MIRITRLIAAIALCATAASSYANVAAVKKYRAPQVSKLPVTAGVTNSTARNVKLRVATKEGSLGLLVVICNRSAHSRIALSMMGPLGY